MEDQGQKGWGSLSRAAVVRAEGGLRGGWGLYMYAIAFGLASVGITAVTTALTGRGPLWGITTGESKLGGLVWASLVDPGIAETLYYREFKLVNPLTDPSQTIVLGILLGGLVASLFLGEFGLRHFPNGWMLLQAVVGGFLLGYGARLALGCNIGNFLSAWASAGLNAVSFTAGMVPGVWAGTRIYESIFLWRSAPLRAVVISPGQGVQRLAAFLTILSLVPLLLLHPLPGPSAVWMIFGILFGVIGYLSKLCWATGLRELVSPSYGSGRMARAVAITILVYSAGVWILYSSGVHVGFALARGMGQLQILVGGLIFGVGMGIAGTCIFSSEWRAGAGSVYSVIAFLSTVLLGMPTLAYHYEWWKTSLGSHLPSYSFYQALGGLGVLVPLTFAGTLFLTSRRAFTRRSGAASAEAS